LFISFVVLFTVILLLYICVICIFWFVSTRWFQLLNGYHHSASLFIIPASGILKQSYPTHSMYCLFLTLSMFWLRLNYFTIASWRWWSFTLLERHMRWRRYSLTRRQIKCAIINIVIAIAWTLLKILICSWNWFNIACLMLWKIMLVSCAFVLLWAVVIHVFVLAAVIWITVITAAALTLYTTSSCLNACLIIKPKLSLWKDAWNLNDMITRAWVASSSFIHHFCWELQVEFTGVRLLQLGRTVIAS